MKTHAFRRFLSALCLLAIASAPVLAADATPRPAATQKAPAAGRGSYTDHDFRRALLIYDRATLVERYRQVGKRSPAWDAEAEAFLDAMARYFTAAGIGPPYRTFEIPTMQDLMRLCEAALSAGCDDPLVRYGYALTLHETHRYPQALEVLEPVVDELYDSGYSLNRAYAASGRLVSLLRWNNRGADADAALERALGAMAAVVGQQEFGEVERRVHWKFFGEMIDTVTPAQHADFYSRAQRVPNADPWLVNMIGGKHHIQAAWAARGKGWAHEVNAQGWKLFGEHLARARDHLVTAHKLRPEYPEAATLMITVALGAGDELNESARTWFDRGRDAEFDYQPAYSSYLWYLRPRWHGSHGQMYAFGLECLRTDRFDTNVPWQFVAAVQDISSELGDASFWQRPGVYENAKTYFEKQAAAVPLESDANWYRSYLAAVAWRNGRHVEAREMLDRLGDRVGHDGFDRMGVMANLAISHAYAMSGDHGTRLAAAEQAAARGTPDGIAEALESYDRVLPQLAPDDKARRFVLGRATELRLQPQYEAGDWLDIQPTAEMACWNPMSGDWSVDEEGRVVLRVVNSHERLVFHPGFLGNDYEFEGVVEFPSPDSGEKPAGNAGPLFAHFSPALTFGANFRRREGEVAIMQSVYRADGARADLPERCAFRVRLTGGRVTVEVNGNEVYSNYELSDKQYFPGRHYVGLSGFTSRSGVSFLRSADSQASGRKSRPASAGGPLDRFGDTLRVAKILGARSARQRSAAWGRYRQLRDGDAGRQA